MTSTTNTAATRSVPWLIIICGCTIAALTFGPRSAMGFFQLPMLAEKGWDRTLSASPWRSRTCPGASARPSSARWPTTTAPGACWRCRGFIYAAGLVMMAMATTPGACCISAAACWSASASRRARSASCSPPSRATSAGEARSFVFGIGTAAGSAGMFLFAPLSQGLIYRLGWSDTLVFMAIAMLVFPLLAIPLRRQFASRAQGQQAAMRADDGRGAARGVRRIELRAAGVGLLRLRLPGRLHHRAFSGLLADIGIDARLCRSSRMALIGFFNIIGSLSAGYHRPALFEADVPCPGSISPARSLVTAFLLLPQTPASVIVFSIVMGLLWLSTVPPTNALVAIMFGTRHLGMLGGVVFLSHQIGSFLGVWLGGYLYDRFGSYDPVWWLGVALGLFAAIVHWPIREAPVRRGRAGAGGVRLHAAGGAGWRPGRSSRSRCRRPAACRPCPSASLPKPPACGPGGRRGPRRRLRRCCGRDRPESDSP